MSVCVLSCIFRTTFTAEYTFRRTASLIIMWQISVSLIMLFALKQGLTNYGLSANLPVTCFYMACELKKGFHIFKWLEKKSKEQLLTVCDTWRLYEIQISVFLNEVSLVHVYSHSFIYYLWLLSSFRSEVAHFYRKFTNLSFSLVLFGMEALPIFFGWYLHCKSFSLLLLSACVLIFLAYVGVCLKSSFYFIFPNLTISAFTQKIYSTYIYQFYWYSWNHFTVLLCVCCYLSCFRCSFPTCVLDLLNL